MNTVPNFETLTEYLLQFADTLQRDVTQFAAFAKTLAMCCKNKSAKVEIPKPLESAKQMSAVLPKGEELKKYKGKTVRPRSDGRWWARYYIDGKQRSVYGRTETECYNRLKEALRQNNTGSAIISSSISLGDWLTKWLELYKVGKVKPSTLEQMERYIKDIQPIANRPLKKLTAIEIQAFLNNVEKPRKREKLFEYLKDALTKAVKNKLLTDNLFDGIDKPKHDKKPSRALTLEEERRFVEACKQSKQGNLYLLCLYQGLRLGEALALTYADIDFDKHTIKICKSIDSKGNVTTPKTANSVRTLPMFSRTMELLDKNKQGKLFNYARKVYQNSMLKICKSLKLDGISIHSLRHTFATRCSEVGIPAKVVQKWLGHSTLEMTLNVYTHVNADFEQKEAAKFDTYFDTHSV